jgi:hypothetical protein
MKLRSGVSLIEALTALALGGLLCVVLIAALAASRRGAAAHALAIERVEARRLAAVVLAAEVRNLVPGEDFEVPERAVLELRAVRGIAISCGAADGAVFIRYRGMRDPEPRKDSVIAITAAAERVLALAETAPVVGQCHAEPGEVVLGWRFEGEPPPGRPLYLLFERGSYHLSDRALRYRRGDGGRQPLTPEIYRDAGSGFVLGDRALEVLLDEGTSSGPVRFRIALANALENQP